jgi:16S rRNA G966 N2-methylase RsmD
MFPMLAENEMAALAADIATNGLHEPLTLWHDPERGDVLLDGRNRLAACDRVGVEPTIRFYDGDNPIGFAVSENIERRHLTNDQRRIVALATIDLYEAEAAQAQKEGGRRGGSVSPKDDKVSATSQQPSETEYERKATTKAAKATGTSGRGVAQAKRVAEQAPDLHEKVRAGDITFNRAERILRDREAEARKVAEAKAAAEAAPIELSVDLRFGDLVDAFDDVADGTVNAIITDPPYPGQYVPLFKRLAELAGRLLTPEGVMVVLSGQTWLPEVFAALDGPVPYRWTGCLLTEGPGYVSHPRRVQSSWKPLLVYGGGPRFGDVFRSEGTDAHAKSLHKWGQDYGAFHEIVRRFTTEGQTVCDPFMGSGTTLLAAHALGRHVLGCDVDQAAYDSARERLGCP